MSWGFVQSGFVSWETNWIPTKELIDSPVVMWSRTRGQHAVPIPFKSSIITIFIDCHHQVTPMGTRVSYMYNTITITATTKTTTNNDNDNNNNKQRQR